MEIPQSTGQPLDCRVETSFAPLESFRERWDEAAIQLGGTVYMSFDWARTWWDFYGQGRQLRIFIFSCGGEIVGILPLYLDSLGIWPCRFTVARLVGAQVPPKIFDPPVHADWAMPIFERLLQRLAAEDGCDLLSFGLISEAHPAAVALSRLGQERPELVAAVEPVRGDVHTIFALPATMDDYFAGLGKSERKKRQYELRLLRKECNIRMDVLREPAAVAEEFERFVEHHTAQWQAEGKPGHFGAWPKARDFNRALVRAQAAQGRVRFHRIFADDELVSTQYGFAFGSWYFWELPARAMGKKWDRLSLGPAGAISMLEAAIQEGQSRVEGGLGHYEYKLKLGATEHPLVLLRVVARRSGSMLKLKLFKGLNLFMRYAYHRLWYRRISPHLPPSLRSPQWNLWLRLDF